jgi:hypothetical protein
MSQNLSKINNNMKSPNTFIEVLFGASIGTTLYSVPGFILGLPILHELLQDGAWLFSIVLGIRTLILNKDKIQKVFKKKK